MSRIARSLVALLPVALAASLLVATPTAQAAETYATRTVLDVGTGTGKLGFSFYPGGSVYADAAAGTQYHRPGGKIYLEMLAAGSTTWVRIAEDFVSTSSTEPTYLTTSYQGNAQYRLYYAGSTHGPSGTVWEPSYSNVASVITKRGSEAAKQKVRSGGRFILKGYVPGMEGKRILVQEKVRGAARWHKFKKVRVNATGHYKVRVPGSRRGIFHRVKIKASLRFPAHTSRKWIAVVF